MAYDKARQGKRDAGGETYSMFKKRRPDAPEKTTEDAPDSIAPWVMLHEDEIASYSVQLSEEERPLTAFARRTDTGAFACFDKGPDGTKKSVVVLTADGAERAFHSFGAWFDAAVRDAG